LNQLSSRRRTFRFWVNAWLPVLIAVLVIAIESTPEFGSENTSRPLRWIFEHLFGPVSDMRWYSIHHHIRKLGHFIGYGLVGLTWLRAWWMTFPRWSFVHSSVLAVLGTAVIAGSDEFHQTFLPNRTGMFDDVILDCCGALVLQFLIYIFLRLFRPRRLEHTA
jgi:VanZ family protein